MKIAIAGAGFTGAVLAHKFADNGYSVDVYDSRNHIGGNCCSEIDVETGIIIHKYGPHIFHTDNESVWQFINQFSEFMPYVNRVKTVVDSNVYSLPVNLHTINQFFGKTFSPNEAKSFIKSISDQSIETPETFEQQALKFVGRDLYEAFFKGYTVKQWGIEPDKLPASILKRLPLRFNYNDNYFNHKFQGMPKHGYTAIFEKILDNKKINLRLNNKINSKQSKEYDHIFYTGPIDEWFDHVYGRLGYRTLDFKKEVHDGDYQGCAVMNYGDQGVPYTRISEHKHFSPWNNHDKTIIYKEYSRNCEADDIPYYPIRLVKEKNMLMNYVNLAEKQEGISFLGRLGTYRYLDMDVTIAEALSAADTVVDCISKNKKIPVFFVNPI